MTVVMHFLSSAAKAFVGAAAPAVGVAVANGIDSLADFLIAAAAGVLGGVAVWATPNRPQEPPT